MEGKPIKIITTLPVLPLIPGQMESQINASCKTRTCVWTCNGWPNGFASRLASSCKSQKVVNFKHKKFTCNKLVFTCVGWPNAENRALNCTWIWTQPKSTQVIASQGTRLVTWNKVECKSKISVDLWVRLSRALWSIPNTFFLSGFSPQEKHRKMYKKLA